MLIVSVLLSFKPVCTLSIFLNILTLRSHFIIKITARNHVQRYFENTCSLTYWFYIILVFDHIGCTRKRGTLSAGRRTSISTLLFLVVIFLLRTLLLVNNSLRVQSRVDYTIFACIWYLLICKVSNFNTVAFFTFIIILIAVLYTIQQ